MKAFFLRNAGRLISLVIFLSVLFVIIIRFQAIFPWLDHSSLSFPSIKHDTPNNIPISLTFLSDDKKSFLDYCGTIYGDKMPLTLDENVFYYYGAVDGYRLYRMQADPIPFERAAQSEAIGYYVFGSDRLYRPYALGLYVVGDDGVFPLDTAFQKNLINISDVYNLYYSKTYASDLSLK